MSAAASTLEAGGAAAGGAAQAPRGPGAMPDDVLLMDFPISRLRRGDVGAIIVESLARGEGGWVFTPNLDILRQLATKPDYAAMCRAATLRTPDGMPLLWAARAQGTPLHERVSGSDLIWSVTERAASAGRSMYFLGGAEGAAEAAVAELRRRWPVLRVAGIECPPLGFEKDAAYMAGLVGRLRGAAPDIVYVALSTPKQDYLIRDLRPQLPRTWFLGIGISFSFVAGEVKRAPRWAQRVGLEWCHRLIQEPRKLAKRYLVDDVPFLARLLVASARRRGRAGLVVPGRR